MKSTNKLVLKISDAGTKNRRKVKLKAFPAMFWVNALPCNLKL